MLLYNLISIFGFFSYAFGLALVPWALATRLTLKCSRPITAFLLDSAFGAILLFCHVFVFGVYATMTAGFILAFAPVLAALFALYLALPFELGAAANVDKRMPIAIAFLALAGLDIHIRRDVRSFLPGSLIIAALLVKQSALAVLWRSFDFAIDAAVSSIETLPVGTVVMQSECHPEVRGILSAYRKWQPSMTHIAALASFDDTRFVASTWAIPGQQPIAIKPPYGAYNRLQTAFKSSTCAVDEYHAQLASIRTLAETDPAATPAPPLYFFLIRPPASRLLVPDADLVAAGRDFELYAVKKPLATQN